MNLDPDQAMPLVFTNDPSGFVRLVNQRNADLARLTPLIEAALAIELVPGRVRKLECYLVATGSGNRLRAALRDLGLEMKL